MPTYQVIGKFAGASSYDVCWKGETSFLVEAQSRLVEAQEYAEQRVVAGGQPSVWKIKEKE